MTCPLCGQAMGRYTYFWEGTRVVCLICPRIACGFRARPTMPITTAATTTVTPSLGAGGYRATAPLVIRTAASRKQ